MEATPTSVPSGTSLEVLTGFYEGLCLPVDRPRVVIGRGRGADYVIADPTLSRAHAAFGHDAEGWFVEDLGSTNGTLVNGTRRGRTPIGLGDEVQMGALKFRLVGSG